MADLRIGADHPAAPPAFGASSQDLKHHRPSLSVRISLIHHSDDGGEAGPGNPFLVENARNRRQSWRRTVPTEINRAEMNKNLK
jgi:hypothetical protein